MSNDGTMAEGDLPVRWELLKDAFEFDGSWRDIYVLDTDLAIWERVLVWIRGLAADGVARLEYEPGPMPKTAFEIFAQQRTTGGGPLRIFVGGVQFNCHFFGELEIEFDIDPREINGPTEGRAVVDFMRGLAHAANCPVHLTEENWSNQRWLTYDPRLERWQFLPGGVID